MKLKLLGKIGLNFIRLLNPFFWFPLDKNPLRRVFVRLIFVQAYNDVLQMILVPGYPRRKP